jgi:hypothetical protein
VSLIFISQVKVKAEEINNLIELDGVMCYFPIFSQRLHVLVLEAEDNGYSLKNYNSKVVGLKNDVMKDSDGERETKEKNELEEKRKLERKKKSSKRNNKDEWWDIENGKRRENFPRRLDQLAPTPPSLYQFYTTCLWPCATLELDKMSLFIEYLYWNFYTILQPRGVEAIIESEDKIKRLYDFAYEEGVYVIYFTFLYLFLFYFYFFFCYYFIFFVSLFLCCRILVCVNGGVHYTTLRWDGDNG